MSGAILVKGAAVLIVEECSVSSETGHCIVIQGVNSCGYIMHSERENGLEPACAIHLACQPYSSTSLCCARSAHNPNPNPKLGLVFADVVHHAKGVGVLVCDHAKGIIEDNAISCNGRAGIAILSGGDPIVCGNKISNGMDSGVLVSEKGRGRVENNDIFGNRRAGVAILKEGAPLVKRNRIYNGCDSGVLVCENGKGSVIDNDIFANHMAGVAIGRGGASRVTGNTIRDGNGGSLCLSVHSKGLILANVIHQDPRLAMQVV